MAEDQKAEEMDIFHKWKQTGEKKHFQALYNSMKPLIYSAAQKASYGSNIPESAHRIYAAQNFLEALRTFKPGTGASLQTHVYGSVHQKAKRLNYTYGNLGFITEPRAAKVGLFQTEHANLRDSLGREPTTQELATRLNWSVKDVANLQNEVHKDLALAEGVEEQATVEGSIDEEKLEMLYFDLLPEEKAVFDYVFGKHGKPRLLKPNNKIDYEQLGRSSGYSASKARAIMIKIKDKYSKALKR